MACVDGGATRDDECAAPFNDDDADDAAPEFVDDSVSDEDLE